MNETSGSVEHSIYSHEESSFGEWLIPSILGIKIIPSRRFSGGENHYSIFVKAVKLNQMLVYLHLRKGHQLQKELVLEKYSS